MQLAYHLNLQQETALNFPQRLPVVFALVLLFAVDVIADTATSALIELEQRGQTFYLTLHGDEYFHWYETKDGYTIVRGQDGMLHYGILNNSGELIPSKLLLGDEPAGLKPRIFPEADVIRDKRYRPVFEKEFANQSKLKSFKFLGNVRKKSGELNNLVLLIRFSDHATRALPTKDDLSLIHI